MKERPILMSAPMVKALRAGSKTQTRRILKCPHKNENGKMVWEEPYRFSNGCGPVSGMYRSRGGWELWGPIGEDGRGLLHEWGFECPLGAVGDRLWTKEVWTTRCWNEADRRVERVCYGADAQMLDREPAAGWKRPQASLGSGWVTPLFMPRWASRDTLEIANVRVERLQAISADDAVAEGIASTEFWTPKELDKRPFEEKWWDDYHFWNHYPQMVYRRLWESIHGADSWEHDPLVWCISFKVL